MAGFGTGMGRAITGYYGGKEMRNRSEDHDYDEARQRRNEGILDPLRLKIAKFEYDKAKLESELRAAQQTGMMNDVERDEAGAVRTEAIEVASQPGRVRQVGYADTAATNADEYGRRVQPYRLNEADRNEELDAADQPHKVAGLGRTERAAIREDRYGEMLSEQAEDQFSTQEIVYSADEALAAFDASGNPNVFDDFYREKVPDGMEVTTEPDPDVPGGFIMTLPDGSQKKAANAQQLRDGFEKVFKNPQMIDRMIGRGSLPSQPGGYKPDVGAYGRRGGIGSYGGSGGTFKDRFFPQVLAAIREGDPNLTEGQATLKALEVLSERGGLSDANFYRETHAKLLAIIMRDIRPGPRRDAAIQALDLQMQELMEQAGDGGGYGGEGGGLDPQDEEFRLQQELSELYGPD